MQGTDQNTPRTSLLKTFDVVKTTPHLSNFSAIQIVQTWSWQNQTFLTKGTKANPFESIYVLNSICNWFRKSAIREKEKSNEEKDSFRLPMQLYWPTQRSLRDVVFKLLHFCPNNNRAWCPRLVSISESSVPSDTRTTKRSLFRKTPKSIH